MCIEVDVMPPKKLAMQPRQVGKTKASREAITAARRATEIAQTLAPWFTTVDLFHMSAVRGAMHRPAWLRKILVREG